VAALRTNKLLNGTLGINVQVQMAFSAANFVKEIVSLYAYGGSSVVRNPTGILLA
jgi:hypothetical protein